MESVLPLTMVAGVERLDYTLDNWTLLGTPSHDKNRTFVFEVVFERAFSSCPVVHLGVVGFDISNHDSARLKVHAADITPSGFSIVAETWFNTQIHSVDVSWLALGT